MGEKIEIRWHGLKRNPAIGCQPAGQQSRYPWPCPGVLAKREREAKAQATEEKRSNG